MKGESRRGGVVHGGSDRVRDRLRVMHVILIAGEPNSQYNQHCLPLKDVQDISICTYFKPPLAPPPEIALYAGDDTIRGSFRALYVRSARESTNVIHAHAPHTATLVSLALAARPHRWRLRRRLVYTVRDSFHDYKTRNKLLMLPGLLWPRVVFCGQAAYDSYPILAATRRAPCPHRAERRRPRAGREGGSPALRALGTARSRSCRSRDSSL